MLKYIFYKIIHDCKFCSVLIFLRITYFLQSMLKHHSGFNSNNGKWLSIEHAKLRNVICYICLIYKCTWNIYVIKKKQSVRISKEFTMSKTHCKQILCTTISIIFRCVTAFSPNSGTFGIQGKKATFWLLRLKTSFFPVAVLYSSISITLGNAAAGVFTAVKQPIPVVHDSFTSMMGFSFYE